MGSPQAGVLHGTAGREFAGQRSSGGSERCELGFGPHAVAGLSHLSAERQRPDGPSRPHS
jgi:hypothetical protein